MNLFHQIITIKRTSHIFKMKSTFWRRTWLPCGRNCTNMTSSTGRRNNNKRGAPWRAWSGKPGTSVSTSTSSWTSRITPGETVRWLSRVSNVCLYVLQTPISIMTIVLSLETIYFLCYNEPFPLVVGIGLKKCF